MFTCPSGNAEDCVKALCDLGVGASVAATVRGEPKGKGMILVLPVQIERVGSQPKTCGHPGTVPYGASVPASSETTPPDNIKLPPLDSIDSSSSPQTQSTVDELIDDAEIEEDLEIELEEKDGTKAMLTGTFYETIQSRISVDTVISYVYAASEFSFDYVNLILCASIIACVGLVTNNTVIIVASMLVSPLMGPIMAVTFGAVVEHRGLVMRGLFSETLGLAMCIVVGYIGGLCAAPLCGQSWPTPEMASRGVTSALWTGVAIAVPSGFGAALSV